MIKILAEHEYDGGSPPTDFLQTPAPRVVILMVRSNFGWTANSRPRWRSGEFNVNVIKHPGIDQLLPNVKTLWW